MFFKKRQEADPSPINVQPQPDNDAAVHEHTAQLIAADIIRHFRDNAIEQRQNMHADPDGKNNHQQSQPTEFYYDNARLLNPYLQKSKNRDIQRGFLGSLKRVKETCTFSASYDFTYMMNRLREQCDPEGITVTELLLYWNEKHPLPYTLEDDIIFEDASTIVLKCEK